MHYNSVTGDHVEKLNLINKSTDRVDAKQRRYAHRLRDVMRITKLQRLEKETAHFLSAAVSFMMLTNRITTRIDQYQVRVYRGRHFNVAKMV